VHVIGLLALHWSGMAFSVYLGELILDHWLNLGRQYFTVCGWEVLELSHRGASGSVDEMRLRSSGLFLGEHVLLLNQCLGLLLEWNWEKPKLIYKTISRSTVGFSPVNQPEREEKHPDTFCWRIYSFAGSDNLSRDMGQMYGARRVAGMMSSNDNP
jgi:hypothetical protein